MDLSQRTKFYQYLQFCFSLITLIKSWFDVPTIQMLVFVLSVSAGVLFDGAFSLWVSLKGVLILEVNNGGMCFCQFIMLLYKKRCLHESQKKRWLWLSFVNPRKAAEAVLRRCSSKKLFLKISQIPQTPVLESVFNKVTGP